MSRFLLSLRFERIAPKTTRTLPAATRLLYLRAGDVVLRSVDQASGLCADSGWYGAAAAYVTAGSEGADLLRWELNAHGAPASADDDLSRLLLAREVDLSSTPKWLLRLDRVSFPPGGIAYTHTHRGPGIRHLIRGAIRIESGAHAQEIRAGEPWFESGPEPVLATASPTEHTAFVRAMLLPVEYLGRSSITYVLPEDQDKPKVQRYRLYVDEPLAL